MYYEVNEADINFAKIGRMVLDSLIAFGADKAYNFISNTMSNHGAKITVTSPDSSTQIMCRIVDNSLPYDEFAASRSKYDVDFHFSVDKHRKPGSLKFADIVRNAFNK